MMNVIPAIDLLDGKIVRLSQGMRDKISVYSGEPVEFAKKFVNEGAEWLHVVDLNAAFGTGNNFEVILRLSQSSGARVQVGGGIRTVEYARRLFDAGVERIIIGTAALDRQNLSEFALAFGKKVWIACDVKNNMVAVEGWEKNTRIDAEKFLLRLVADFGIGGAIITDTSRDGRRCGISLDFFRNFIGKTKLSLYAAGGITTTDDICALAKIGYDGAIIGRALYEKCFSFKEAMEAAQYAG